MYKYTYVRVCVCERAFEPDALLTGAGPWRSSEPLFSLAKISGPQGPVPQRRLCYPLESFIVAQITPVEKEKKQHGQISSMHNVNERIDGCSVQKFHLPQVLHILTSTLGV